MANAALRVAADSSVAVADSRTAAHSPVALAGSNLIRPGIVANAGRSEAITAAPADAAIRNEVEFIIDEKAKMAPSAASRSEPISSSLKWRMSRITSIPTSRRTIALCSSPSL